MRMNNRGGVAGVKEASQGVTSCAKALSPGFRLTGENGKLQHQCLKSGPGGMINSGHTSPF